MIFSYFQKLLTQPAQWPDLLLAVVLTGTLLRPAKMSPLALLQLRAVTLILLLPLCHVL